MDADIADDGRILERESDNEDLWWERAFDQKCCRCGINNISYTDYYWTEDGDDIPCSPRCNVCHYDSEMKKVIHIKVSEPDPNVSIELTGPGTYIVRYRQETGEWKDGQVL